MSVVTCGPCMVYGLSFELGIQSSLLHLTRLLLNMVLIIKRQTAGVHAILVGKLCEHFIIYQILKFERILTSAGRFSQIISYQILKFERTLTSARRLSQIHENCHAGLFCLSWL